MNAEQIMELAVNYAITRGNYRECHSYANKTFLDADKETLQTAIEALVQERDALKHAIFDLAEADKAALDRMTAERDEAQEGERAQADMRTQDLMLIDTLTRERDALKAELAIVKMVAAAGRLYVDENKALRAELEDERTRGLQLLADAKEWQQQFIGAQAEVRELRVEVKTLRDALNNCEDALMNSQTVINKDSVGFAKVCREANEMALGIARAALGETK